MRNEITKITTSEAKEKGHEGEEKESGRVKDNIKCEQGSESKQKSDDSERLFSNRYIYIIFYSTK